MASVTLEAITTIKSYLRRIILQQTQPAGYCYKEPMNCVLYSTMKHGLMVMKSAAGAKQINS